MRIAHMNSNLEKFNLIDHIKLNNFSKIKELIDSKKNLHIKDEFGNTPLIWAVIFDKIEIVNLLIEAGADVSAKDLQNWDMMDWAKYYDRKEIIEILKKSKLSTKKVKKVKGKL